MHPRFLDCLCCPLTGEALRLDVEQQRPEGMVDSGSLIAPSGTRFPILRGIPRFVSAEQYSASFGYEWNRWPRVQFEAENVGRPLAGWTTRMWERITDAAPEEVQGKTIVDFGCGSGRFLDVVRRKGGRAVGIDLSLAVEAARANFRDDPEVLIVQGDVLKPPFRSGAFDGGYSIGVLHHTPDPDGGVRALARTVGAGGWIACCVYPKDGLYDFRSTARLRGLHNRFKSRLGYRPTLAYSLFSAYALAPVLGLGLRLPGLRRALTWMERNWLVVVHLPDARWRVLDTFDAITPALASTHTSDEVRTWMQGSGCRQVRPTDWCTTSFRGIRI